MAIATAARSSSSDALADLKDKYLDRFELYHFLDQEEQDIELFNGMLDRTRCEEAIERLVPDAARGGRLVHLRTRVR